MERNTLENGVGPINIYQPGNVTRYEIICLELKPGLDLFVWVNAPSEVKSCTKLSQGSFMPSWWLADRMSLRESDCAALLAWLRDERGYQVTMPEGYGEDGCYAPQVARGGDQ